MQIVQEMTASQTHEYIVLFVALFFTFLQSNLSSYFQVNIQQMSHYQLVGRVYDKE